MTATAPKPRILDLFCGAGGCTKGYQDAGFYVVGVDNRPQPNYCGDEFHEEDALQVLEWLNGYDNPYLGHQWSLSSFDAIHASPPCQAYSTMGQRYPKKQAEHPDLIGPVRALLERTGLPWVIENVEGARSSLRSPVKFCGYSLGLTRLKRHRLFESNIALMAPPCSCYQRGVKVIGVYGDRPDGRRLNTRMDGSEQRAATSLADGQDAMGIDWMEWRELTQAIPPVYTEVIGAQILSYLSSKAAA